MAHDGRRAAPEQGAARLPLDPAFRAPTQASAFAGGTHGIPRDTVLGVNPLIPFVRRQGIVVLDGGLATTLEARGHDLNHPLWSAKVLLEDPDAIGAVHRAFLEAGADCITTCTYQASLPGFAACGLDEDEATRLLARAVDLAADARDSFWEDPANRRGRLRPLVAASVGPYGAYLADGSEYSGDYGIDAGELLTFHEARWHVLSGTRADLLACETVPSQIEAQVLLGLIRDTPGRWAWLSFSCRDGAHLNDGSRLEQAAGLCAGEPSVAAVGVNCTAPQHISSLLGEMRNASARKPTLVYPNSGERWDAADKTWMPAPIPGDWAALAQEWTERGASGIGGCCRVSPATIAQMRSRLVGTRGEGAAGSA